MKPKFLSVEEARLQKCCRICKGDSVPTKYLGPFVFNFGAEHAHQKCIQNEQIESRLDFISQNLDTCKKWTRSDYEDFYARDVEFLLPLARLANIFDQDMHQFIQEMLDKLDPEMSSSEIRNLRERFVVAICKLEQ